MKRWIAPLLVSLLVAACVPATSVFSPPRFEARSVQVVRLDPPGVGSEAMVVAIDLVVTNPNPVAVSLRDLELDLALDGRSAARSSFPSGIGLPANGSASLPLQVEVPWSGAPSLVGSIGAFLAGTPLDYRIEAALTLDVLGVPQRFGGLVVAQGRLDPPGPWTAPTIRLDPAGAVVTLSGTSLSLEIGVLVDNPSPIGATVRAPGLELRLDGRPLGRIAVVPTALPAAATARIPVRLEVGLVEVGATLAARLAAGGGGELDVTLAGDWNFDAAGTTVGRVGGWFGAGRVR